MTDETTLAQRVKVKREEMQLNQKELAEISGLTQATISRIESGELFQLKVSKFVRLAEALRVTPDFLIGKKKKMDAAETLNADRTARTIFRGYEKLKKEQKEQVKDFVLFLLKKEKKKVEQD